jgi:hypothetical protein
LKTAKRWLCTPSLILKGIWSISSWLTAHGS